MADVAFGNQSGYELKDFVGNVATAVTIGLFMTGIFICKEIKRRGSTADISPFPFLAGCTNCTVWLSYGLAAGDFSIVLVNSVGDALQISYVVYYYVKTTDKSIYVKKLAVMFVFLLAVYTVVYIYFDDKKTMINIMGIIASSCTLAFMGSPLAEIVKVCRTKSTKGMPFPLIFTSFLVAFLWSFYGVLIEDKVVQIPNMIGMAITFLQLLMFVVFRESKLTT